MLHALNYMNKIHLNMNIMCQMNPSYPGHSVVVFLDAVVSLLQTGGLKWGLTHQQSVPERIQTVSTMISSPNHVQQVIFVLFQQHNCFSGVHVCLNLQYTAKRPDVHLVAVAFLAKHFRCNVVRRSTQGLLPLTIKLDFSGQTKVP